MKKLFLFCIATIILLANNMEPDWENNKAYKSPLNPSAKAGYGGQCTAFVWGRVYEKFNIELGINAPRSVPHANKWWTDNLYPKTLKRGSIPKSNSIVIWGGDFHKKNGKYKNPYGHVAFIEKVENGYVYFNEANVETFKNTNFGGGYDGYVKKWTLEKFKKYRPYSGKISGYIYINSSTTSGIFDGAGSLVSPKDDCWGCDKDEARMQPHNGVGSTVVFQWWYDKDICSQIDLIANEDIDVVVRAKGWNKHLTEKEFKVTLGQNPITLKRPNVNNDWTTLAITSIKPVTDTTPIYALCKTSSDEYKKGNRETSGNPSLVDVTSNHYWTGTGSIISQATPRPKYPYGVSKDDAVTFKTKKSLTSFQWDTTNCNDIEVSNDGTNKYTDAIVDIKPWYESSWNKEICKSLPCKIHRGGEAYYIIKVKTKPNAIKQNKFLHAECIK